MGYNSALSLTSGSENSFFGVDAGEFTTSGSYNTFLGRAAGLSNSTGNNNVFTGYQAGYYNTTGNQNVFSGTSAGGNNTTGSSNTFLGYGAGLLNRTAGNNTFVGYQAGYTNSTGAANVFIGNQAGHNNTTGSNNIIIGPNSGTAITTSDDNVLMGYNSQANEGIFNAIAIGANSRVAANNSLILGNQVNVGIGTSAPKSKLEIVADEVDASGLRLSRLTSQSKTTQATDQFLTVNDQGDVVKARYQLRITTAHEWSDKVFLPTYKLRSLASVATYIAQHGHLPNVPSAVEVIKAGVDLVKMNASLLEKIEELTLYSIEQDQKAKRQEARINQLEQRHQQEINELKQLVKQLLEKK